MNRKYIDFVPAKAAKKAVRKKPAAKPAQKPVAKPAAKPAPKSSAADLGVVENLSSKVKSTTKPAHFAVEKSNLKAAKAEKVGAKATPAKPSTGLKKPAASSTYQAPKTQFINQDKVQKRPLSKNVYRKEVKATEEKPKAPVTIITKPEKDARVGLVITIILTIILGAAAGTVAFLLLPK